MITNLKEVTQSLEPFKANPFLTMKLIYNDSVPEDYETLGFHPIEIPEFSLLGEPVEKKCGAVDNSHHTMNIKVISDKERFITMN